MGCLSSKQFAEHPLLAETSSPTHSINRDVIPEAKLAEMVKSIPTHKVQSMKNQSTLWRINGPDGKQDEASFKDIAIGKTISTYPTYSTGLRFGDPIADVFSAIGFEHAVCAVVCDGCGWGERSKRAANIACQSFTQYIEERISKVDDITAGVILILKALEFAHISIMKGVDPYESGSTTLTGGLLLKQEDRGWGFVCCNIGDAKAFHWSATTRKITDITHGNRRNLSDATDPGGRLGSSGGDPDPDLRNLGVYYFPCQQKDIIFLLSDGAHDNLDPQQLGVTPAEMKIQAKDWHDAERYFPKQTEAAKTGYTNELLHNKLLDTENTPLTPKFISDAIIQHCFQITKNTREFMQSNPQARQPDDHSKFPGKLDHTTVVAFTVGYS